MEFRKLNERALRMRLTVQLRERLAKAKHINSITLKGPRSISVQKAHLAFVSSVVFNQYL